MAKKDFSGIQNIINENMYGEKSNSISSFFKKKPIKDETNENNWRVLDKAPELPKQKKKKPRSREQILESLGSVFIDDTLKDDIVTRTAIPDLLEGTEPAFTGVILFGPPGTGKTVLLNAIGKVYEASNAYSKEISVSSVMSSYVGQFAKNLEDQIKIAIGEAETRRKPSFLYFDEGSTLAQSAEEGASSVSKHYQEAIDVMKRYIGNDRRLVVAISTNLLSESFEDALTREGRLTSFFIGYPDAEQRKRMWKHFSNEYNVLKLSDSQAQALADITPAEQGAFIEEFARNYTRARRNAILRERGFITLVDALKKGANVKEAEVTKSINFDTFCADLEASLKAKYQRNGVETEPEQSTIGFGSK